MLRQISLRSKHETSWKHLTVQLSRLSEDDAGDPDLYGMFYGGSLVRMQLVRSHATGLHAQCDEAQDICHARDRQTSAISLRKYSSNATALCCSEAVHTQHPQHAGGL